MRADRVGPAVRTAALTISRALGGPGVRVETEVTR
jgi:hypothetical protein